VSSVSFSELISKIQQDEFYLRENANMYDSAAMIEFLTYAKLIEPLVLSEIEKNCGKEIVEKHIKGEIHIHKLKDGGFFKPYCGGFYAVEVIRQGFETSSCASKPPKHLDSAVDQLVNFICACANERTGAVGLGPIESLAPFIRFDKLDYKQVKQCIQRFVFNLNYSTRTGHQTPFSNITFYLIPRVLKNFPAYVGGKYVGTLDEYEEEIAMLFRAFLEVYFEGDAYGRPFTFPIPTVIVNEEFFKWLETHNLKELFFKVVVERGVFNFQNGVIIDPLTLFSFCCRVTANTEKVKKFTRGIWVLPPTVGSIGYVSINLPYLALKLKSEGKDIESHIFDLIYEDMKVGRKVLMFLRRRYEIIAKQGGYPITLRYIGPNPFKYYYNTIAVVGLPEYVTIVLNNPKLWNLEISLDGYEYKKEIINVETKVLEFMNKVLEEFEKEDNVLYNLEQAPAESTVGKFAKACIRDFGKLAETYLPSAKDPFSRKIEYFMSSQNTPSYTTYRLETQLEIEGATQKLFTGGVMKFINIHRPIEPRQAELLVKSCINHGLIYYALNITQVICLDCGFRSIKLLWQCPICGSTNIEILSRIVGYYRPIRNWNPARRAEFTTRQSI